MFNCRKSSEKRSLTRFSKSEKSPAFLHSIWEQKLNMENLAYIICHFLSYKIRSLQNVQYVPFTRLNM